MRENEVFKIRAYGKSELAMLYFPGDSKNKRLRKFITPKRKYYSPKQVRVIIDELGEPDIQ